MGGTYDSFDLFDFLVRSFRKIPSKWRQSFYILAAINFFVFMYTIVNQPLGNHDYMNMPWIYPWDQFDYGRWFASALFFLFGHATLPVVLYTLAVCLNVLAAMGACILWKMDRSVTTMVLLGLVVTLIPSANFYYYHLYIPYMFTGANVLVIAGLLTASKNSFRRISLGACLVMLGLATYQVALNVLAVVFTMYVLFEVARAQWSWPKTQAMLKEKVVPKIAACVAGGLLYYGSLVLLRQIGLLTGSAYQLETNSVADFIGNLPSIYQAFVNEFTLSQAFMPIHVKYALLIIVLSALLTVTIKSMTSGKEKSARFFFNPALTVCIFGAAFCGTKIMFLVSTQDHFNALKWGGGLAFFFMACTAILIESRSVFIRNASYGVILFVLVNFAWNDLLWQQIWVRGNEHDRAALSRILGRIESMPEIDYNKQYDYLQIGKYPSFQETLYKKRDHGYEIAPGSQFLQRITLPVFTSNFYEFLGARIKMRNLLIDAPDYLEKLQIAIDYAEKNQPWPSQGSVTVIDDLVVVYLDESSLEALKELADLLDKQENAL